MFVVLLLKKTKHYLFHLRRIMRRATGRLKSIIKAFVKRAFPALVEHVKFTRLATVVNDYYGYDLKRIQLNPIRVAVIARDARHYPKSSLFIRLISPLSILARRGKVDFSLYGENTTKVSAGTDVIIVQRTAFDSASQADALIAFASANKVPVVLDNDDNFRAIDGLHSEYEQQKERLLGLEAVAKAARQIWVSTSPLREAYGEFKRKTTVVANATDTRLWANGATKHSRRSKADGLRMVYMGTATHDEDFKLILGALKLLHDKYPGQFSLTLIGVSNETVDFPWFTRLYQPKGVSLYPKFVRWFLEQGPYDIGLSPLRDSAFNNGKSDIKCLDYIMSGVHPLASDVIPYSVSPLKRYATLIKNNQEDWYRVLEEYIVNRTDYRRAWAKDHRLAKKYIIQHREGEQIAEVIHRKLEQLVGKA